VALVWAQTAIGGSASGSGSVGGTVTTAQGPLRGYALVGRADYVGLTGLQNRLTLRGSQSKISLIGTF
jgi:hypothetical protein